MPNILQVPVPTTTAAIVWPSRQSGVNSLLFINQDLDNTIWVGQEPAITAAGPNTIPIPPNGTFSGDAASPWYVIGSTAGIQPLVVVPNGQAFFRGLTQGLGNLAIPSVQSPNFVHGASGWQIAKDGSAEFNNLTIRGVFFGLDFEINSFGVFFYSSAPGPGNLLLSAATAGGTDPYGNTYYEGFCVYNGNGTSYLQLHVNPSVVAPAAEMPTGVASEQGHASLYTFPGARGGPTEEIISTWQGPASSHDGHYAMIQLVSSAANGATTAAGALIYNGVQVAYWDDTGVHLVGGTLYGGNGVLPVGDSVAYARNSGASAPFKGALHISKTAQNSSPSVTGTSYVRLSNIWPLPDNDPAQETVYRVTTRGNLVTPASGGPVFMARLNAFNATSNPIKLGGVAYSGGAQLDYEISAECMVLNPGTSATLYFTVRGIFTVDGANSSGLSAAQNSVAIVQNSYVTGVDTTLPSPNLTIQAAWSTSNSGQGTAGWWDTFERFGEQ